MIGQEERNAVLRVLDSGILSGYKGNWSDAFYGGEEIKTLEKEWAEYFGVKHAIACNSATSGLWMACAAIGLQQNNVNLLKVGESSCGINDCASHLYFNDINQLKPDEVIVTPYSMTCSASIPLHFGAKPVFADIEEDYYCLDVKSIEERITERTKAIIAVDLFGQPYNADEINALAECKGKEYGHKIYVIEDAAQAIGSKYKGEYAGTLGDIGVYSLNFHKHIHCGEGGVVVTNDDYIAYKLRLVMNHAEAVTNDFDRQIEEQKKANPDKCILVSQMEGRPYFDELVGMNLRMTEISAAIAREQLKKLDGILKVVRSYVANFNIKIRPNCEHAFYRYAFTDNIGYPTAETCISAIKDCYKELVAKQHYITPIYKMPLFKSLGYDQNSCPVCEKVEENIVLAWLKDMP